MARVEVPIVVLNSTTGLPVNGAAVNITRRGTGSPATWYTTETGGTASTAALITDANGRVDGWVERGAYNLNVTGTGITPYTEPWDAAPGSDLSVDSVWISDLALLPGEVKLYAGTVIPNGWLLCDGAAVSRTTYARLWTAIGTSFGAGDGSTTFNLPNLKGRVAVGSGQGTGLTNRLLGQTGGAETHLLTSSESGLPNHAHSHNITLNSAGTHSHGGATGGSTNTFLNPRTQQYNTGSGTAVNFGGTGLTFFRTEHLTSDHVHGISADGDHTHTVVGGVLSIAAQNASAAHNNMPPFTVLHYLIKT